MPIDKPMSLIIDDIEGDVHKITKKVVLTVQRSWVLGCPVDTGRARGSVNISVVRKNNSLVSSADPSGGATLSKGAADLARSKPLQAVHVQSAIGYMQKLEDGGSKQNRGFIKQAFLNGQSVAKNA